MTFQFHQLKTEHLELSREVKIKLPLSLGLGLCQRTSTLVPTLPPPHAVTQSLYSPPWGSLQPPTSALTLHIPVSTPRTRSPKRSGRTEMGLRSCLPRGRTGSVSKVTGRLCSLEGPCSNPTGLPG